MTPWRDLPSPSRSWRTLPQLLLVLALASCGAATPQAKTSPAASAAGAGQASTAPGVEAVDPGALPELRTGRVEPVVHASAVRAAITGRFVDGDVELVRLELELPQPLALADAVVAIEAPPSTAGPFAFVESAGRHDEERASVWVRRAADRAPSPIVGRLYTAALHGRHLRQPGHEVRFRAPATAAAPMVRALRARWVDALARHLADRAGWGRGADPWYRFAAARLRDRFEARQAQPPTPNRFRGSAADDLARLMETTTGMTSLQETLQTDRPVFVAAAQQARTIPLGTLEGPKLEAHPFADMLARLARPVPPEPLAEATPAEFYYLRFRDLSTLFELLDELDAWATPAARLLDGRSSQRGLAARYEAQLGLGRGPLTRALGPEVIASVALVGSDPYVREGTDLTAIFQVKSHALFSAGIASALAKHEPRHGALTRSTTTHRGVDITLTRSADGVVRQQRARAGDLEVISNSPAALRRVLDAIAKRRARLADEPDFRYLLARDAKIHEEVLGFAGDRFVWEVIGPGQKILEARRQLALAELQVPGFAALLFGWLNGRSPSSVDELVASGLLRRSDLRHASGEPIRWRPGTPATSSWGAPGALTPLIDRPPPARVSEAEREAYRIFARGYQRNWSTYVDPILLKLETQPGESRDPAKSLRGHLRILPLIDASEYREVADLVGNARVAAPPDSGGIRGILGIGAEAELRRELSRLIRGAMPFGRRLSFDWLGDWAMVGMADRPTLARAVLAVEGDAEVPQRPLGPDEREDDRDDWGALRQAPLYLAVHLASTARAALALMAVRKLAESTAPGLVRWGEHETYRRVTIVQVAITEERRRAARGAAADVEIYYAICDGVLFVALQPELLRHLLDRQLDGRGPRAESSTASGQLIVELDARERGGLATVLAWLLEATARAAGEQSRSSAEILLRGAPEIRGDAAAQRRVALATLGRVPLTPEGQSYRWGPDGARDPLRGTLHAPSWPAIPVADSPTDRLLRSVRRLRSELAFDDEGPTAQGEPLRSLRVGLTIGLRP